MIRKTKNKNRLFCEADVWRCRNTVVLFGNILKLDPMFFQTYKEIFVHGFPKKCGKHDIKKLDLGFLYSCARELRIITDLTTQYSWFSM